MVIRIVGALMFVLGLGVVLAAPGHSPAIILAETSLTAETTPGSEKKPSVTPLSTCYLIARLVQRGSQRRLRHCPNHPGRAGRAALLLRL